MTIGPSISQSYINDLQARVIELEKAIRTHRDARGDDRCWLDDQELYKVLGEDPVPPEQLTLPPKDAFLKRCEAYYENRQKPGCEPWKTVEELEARLAEVAEMNNRMADEAKLRVDSERDACVRKLQFLVETAEKDTKGIFPEGYTRGLKQGISALEARKDRSVQWVDEMAHGSRLGEFIAQHVEQAVEREKAKFAKPPADRPEDGEDFHPGWHATSVIAEGNMASGAQLQKDIKHLEDLARTGYYDNTCGSNDVLLAIAAWLRKMHDGPR